MDSSVSGKDEIRFLGVCHHVAHELYSLDSRLGGIRAGKDVMEKGKIPLPLSVYELRIIETVAQSLPRVRSVINFHTTCTVVFVFMEKMLHVNINFVRLLPSKL